MSQLTNALNRIQTWLTNNYPIATEIITPGLNQEEIQTIIETLPFSLPQEVYELYQWSRGHDENSLTTYTSIFDPYEGMSHSSLERAIELQSILEDEEFEGFTLKYIGKPLFPLFEFDGAYLCTIGDWEDENSSPIIFVSDINEITSRYTSLTSMILTIAESFESGVFCLCEERYQEWNTESFSPIYINYNSDILEVSIRRLKQELITGKDNDTSVERTIGNFEGDIIYLNRERLNLATNQFEIEVFQPLITAIQDENEIVRDLARQALAKLNYNFEQS
jgi:hypothetical protein